MKNKTTKNATRKTLRQHARHHLSQPAVQYACFTLVLILAVASGWSVLYTRSWHRESTVASQQTLTLTSKRDAGAREIMTGQPIAGKRGVIVTVTITNNTGQVQTFIPAHQTFIRDALGNSYSLAPLDEIKHPIAGGQLRAGESRSGELSYIVDKDASYLRLYFDSRWSNGPPIVIDL
jgi:hypothetical protein